VIYFHALANFHNQLVDSGQRGGFYAYWSVVGWESGLGLQIRPWIKGISIRIRDLLYAFSGPHILSFFLA
jgi:hypothetical protein